MFIRQKRTSRLRTFINPASFIASMNVEAALCSCKMLPFLRCMQSPVLGAILEIFFLRGPNSLCSTCGSISKRFALSSSAMFVLRERATLMGSLGLYSTTSTNSRCICERRGSMSLLSVGRISVFISCSSNSSAAFRVSSFNGNPRSCRPLMLLYKISNLVIIVGFKIRHV